MISDIPELLIALGILGGIAWAVYNWARPRPAERKAAARK